MDPLQPFEGKAQGGPCACTRRLIYQLRTLKQEKKEEGIAAHKYEGLTIFQRTTPGWRRDCGDATGYGIIM